MLLTKEQIAAIEAQADRIALGYTLHTQDDLEAAVDEIAMPIGGSSKRRTTLLAIAAGDTSGTPRAEVFRRKEVVSPAVFYNPDKAYSHDLDFRLALEVIIRLYRRWNAAEQARLYAERQAELLEKAYLTANKMFDRANQMMDFPLAEREIGEDGQTIIVKPGNWNYGNVAPLVTAADKVGRSALGMESERTALDVSWVEGLPDGITAEQAEEARRQLAKLLATQMGRTAVVTIDEPAAADGTTP